MKRVLPEIPLQVWGWLGGGWGFRALVAEGLPLGFDEVYYYTYSRHLHWSYFDHPVMVALTTGVGWWLTDTLTPLTMRLGALGLYTLSLLLLYLTAQHLFDAKTGVLAIAIASIAPILWITFGLLTAPDNGLICFWTLTLLIAAWEFIPAPTALTTAPSPPYVPSYRLAILGFTLGLACLSKYHGFVLGFGLVGFCLTSDRARKALWSPWLLLSLLIFALTLTPLWYWNAHNDWFSFRFHLGLRFADSGEPTPYRIWDAVGTWLLGIVYLFPTIGFPLWWRTGRALVTTLRAGWPAPRTIEAVRERDRTHLILWASLPIALGFTLLGGKQAIYPAWPAPGFWGLTLLLAQGASHCPPRLVRRWLGGTGVVVVTLALVALLHVSEGLLQKPGNFSLFGGFVPPAQDGSTALLDAVQLRSHLAQSPDLMQALQDVDFVFTDEFYLSSYVDLALQPLTSLPVTCLSQDPRGYAFWFDPARWVGQNALYFTLASLHHDRAALAAEFQPYFQLLEPLAEVPLYRGGVVTETVLIYRAMVMQHPYRYPYP